MHESVVFTMHSSPQKLRSKLLTLKWWRSGKYVRRSIYLHNMQNSTENTWAGLRYFIFVIFGLEVWGKEGTANISGFHRGIHMYLYISEDMDGSSNRRSSKTPTNPEKNMRKKYAPRDEAYIFTVPSFPPKFQFKTPKMKCEWPVDNEPLNIYMHYRKWRYTHDMLTWSWGQSPRNMLNLWNNE